EEIARRSPVASRPPLAGHAHARAVVDACGDVDRDRLGSAQHAGAVAMATPFVAQHPAAGTAPAGGREPQETRNVADPPRSGAVRTGSPRARRHPARTVAARAGGLRLDGDLRRQAAQGVEESEAERA